MRGIIAYLVPQPVIVTTIRWGYAHVMIFWITVPLLLGFVAARVATRGNEASGMSATWGRSIRQFRFDPPHPDEPSTWRLSQTPSLQPA